MTGFLHGLTDAADVVAYLLGALVVVLPLLLTLAALGWGLDVAVRRLRTRRSSARMHAEQARTGRYQRRL